MAKSPRRRANSLNAQRRCAGQAGSLISVMISSARERGGERGKEEIRGLDDPRSGAADHGDLGVARHRDPRHLRGRIGMGDAAADGAAIANLIMRDIGDGGLEQGMGGIEPRVVLDVAPAHHGAEPHAIAGDLDPPQLGEFAQVDQQRRRCATRNAIIGTRLWPPASTLASPPPAARSATAS